MIFAPFLSILHHLYHHMSFFEIFGIFSKYIVKPNEKAFNVCHNICVKSGYYHNRKTSQVTIILFIFMSDIYFFLYMSDEGCFYFYCSPFCMIYGLNCMNI